MLKVNCITFFSLFLFLISCTAPQEKNTTISPLVDSSYQTLRFPEFKSVKLLYLDKATSSATGSIEKTDSLIAKKILRGNLTFYTFLDSAGVPLSQCYDSLKLNKADQDEIIKLLSKYYIKGNNSILKCGAQFRDAIVFYDTMQKPVGFIEICFGCSEFNFSKSLDLNVEKCNRDSMMNKFIFFFNKMGVSRKSPLDPLPVN